jgi:thiol-disulfide isomerase/thioredoxin
MKKNFFLLILPSLLLLGGMWACNAPEKKPDQAMISGKLSGLPGNAELVVRHYNLELNYDEPVVLDTVTTDSAGRFMVRIATSKPMEILLESEKGVEILFIEPGDSLFFEKDMQDYRAKATNISGKGAEKLNWIVQVNTLFDMMAYIQVDSAQVYEKADEDEQKRQALLKEVDESGASQDFKNYITAMATINAHYFYKLFPSYREMTSNGKSFPADQEKQAYWENQLLSTVPLAIHANKFHDLALDYLLSDEVQEPDKHGLAEHYNQFEARLDSLNLPSDYQSQWMGRALPKWMSMGKAIYMYDVISAFKSRYAKSPHVEVVQKNYREWLALAPGSPAPDFTATNTKGEAVKLSDLKGKVLYVDVWATWCGPCRAEFPHAKVVKKQYDQEPYLVFLYVSVDGSVQKWQEYLANDPSFTGLHWHMPGNFEAEIVKLYKILGIPRYMIIDHNGLIREIEAPRPSNKDALTEALDAAIAAAREQDVAFNRQ